MLILQLLNYSIYIWILWLLLSCALPYRYGFKGMLIGYALVLISIPVLDIVWVQSEMSEPGWDGQPDMDVVFFIGVALRMTLILAVISFITAITQIVKYFVGRSNA